MRRAGFRERFVRRRAGVAAAAVLACLYLSALAAPFLAPSDPQRDAVEYRYAPPQRIHLRDSDGWHRPFVYDLVSARDPSTNELHWTVDPARRLPLRFLAEGDAWSVLGIAT
ncbi:MAG TPA: ABC transporter permease, partial [bacterium]|nr:ABC transporter permease [bacterium]